MKKILVGLMVVSSLAMAQGRGDMDKQGMEKGMKGRNSIYETLTEEQKVELTGMREEYKGAMKEKTLDIKSIGIEVERELLNNQVDWAKVEGLLEEEAQLKAELKLEKLKLGKEVEEEFGIKLGMGNKGGKNKGNRMGRKG